MNTTNETAPQWAVDAAKECTPKADFNPPYSMKNPLAWDKEVAAVAAIIAHHAPQPTAPTAQPPRPEGDECGPINPNEGLRVPAVEPHDEAHAILGSTEPRFTEPEATGTPDTHYAAALDALSDMRHRAARLERELSEATNVASVRADEADGLAAQLAEVRTERDDVKRFFVAAQKDLAEKDAQLTAAQGVIARLRPLLETARAGITEEWKDKTTVGTPLRNAFTAILEALSLTPATYADALGKAEERLRLLTEDVHGITNGNLKWDDEIGWVHKEKLVTLAALRSELAELRGLLFGADCVLEAYQDTLDTALRQPAGTFKRLNVVWSAIRARLATPAAGRKDGQS